MMLMVLTLRREAYRGGRILNGRGGSQKWGRRVSTAEDGGKSENRRGNMIRE